MDQDALAAPTAAAAAAAAAVHTQAREQRAKLAKFKAIIAVQVRRQFSTSAFVSGAWEHADGDNKHPNKYIRTLICAVAVLASADYARQNKILRGMPHGARENTLMIMKCVCAALFPRPTSPPRPARSP